MRRMHRGWIVVLATMALMLMCVAVQGYVGLAANQYVDVMVTGSETGWALWVDYDSSAMLWHGPHFTDFWVTWTPFFYNQWYGVFTYNASLGAYSDLLFKYATF